MYYRPTSHLSLWERTANFLEKWWWVWLVLFFGWCMWTMIVWIREELSWIHAVWGPNGERLAKDVLGLFFIFNALAGWSYKKS